jgi:hypothetical protein
VMTLVAPRRNTSSEPSMSSLITSAYIAKPLEGVERGQLDSRQLAEAAARFSDGVPVVAPRTSSRAGLTYLAHPERAYDAPYRSPRRPLGERQ